MGCEYWLYSILACIILYGSKTWIRLLIMECDSKTDIVRECSRHGKRLCMRKTKKGRGEGVCVGRLMYFFIFRGGGRYGSILWKVHIASQSVISHWRLNLHYCSFDFISSLKLKGPQNLHWDWNFFKVGEELSHVWILISSVFTSISMWQDPWGCTE